MFYFLFRIFFSQFVNFGKNKVQYSDFKWNVLQTEHFQIYYYKREKNLRNRGQIMQKSYKFLQQKFNHSLTDTVPVIFIHHLFISKKQIPHPVLYLTVSGIFEFIKGRVVLPF